MHLPTEHELSYCDRVELTSATEWDSYSDRFAQQEMPHIRLTAHVMNHGGPDCYAPATSSRNHRFQVDAATLAWRCGTSVNIAYETLPHNAVFTTLINLLRTVSELAKLS